MATNATGWMASSAYPLTSASTTVMNPAMTNTAVHCAGSRWNPLVAASMKIASHPKAMNSQMAYLRTVCKFTSSGAC